MNKLNGWEQTTAQMGGAMPQLTPGGHAVKILGVEMVTSRSGREMIVLRFDIEEGSEFDGMYRRIYNSRAQNVPVGTLPKWPNGGTYYQLTADEQGATNPRFKGLIKAVEESNARFVWNWDETRLKGCQVGMIFREEEFEARDGSIRTTIKPIAVCPAREAADKPAPAKKTLTGNVQPDMTPIPKTNNDAFTQVEEDTDLPFDFIGGEEVI